MMANIVLGRLGMMGRLGASVRDEQGLAYYIGSSLNSTLGAQPWDIVAGVHPSNVDRVVSSIEREVLRMRQEPITDEELADCRSHVTGALPLSLETNEGIAGFLLAVERFGLGLDYLQRHRMLIHSVTPDDIQRVVQKYLTLDRYVLSMAGTFD
jgi:zinc protease